MTKHVITRSEYRRGHGWPSYQPIAAGAPIPRIHEFVLDDGGEIVVGDLVIDDQSGVTGIVQSIFYSAIFCEYACHVIIGFKIVAGVEGEPLITRCTIPSLRLLAPQSEATALSPDQLAVVYNLRDGANHYYGSELCRSHKAYHESCNLLRVELNESVTA